MNSGTSARALATCGMFGAAALILPVLFHAVQLGKVFMPMYVPLVALGFLTRPAAAGVTAFIVPLISSALTGMPPLYPPIAIVMAVELSAMAGGLALATRKFPAVNERLILVPMLITGRILNAVLTYGMARMLDLPAEYIAGLSFLAGWPGLVLMVLVVPPLVRLIKKRQGSHAIA